MNHFCTRMEKIELSCSKKKKKPDGKRKKRPLSCKRHDCCATVCTRYSQKCRFVSLAWRAIREHNSCLWHFSRVWAPELHVFRCVHNRQYGPQWHRSKGRKIRPQNVMERAFRNENLVIRLWPKTFWPIRCVRCRTILWPTSFNRSAATPSLLFENFTRPFYCSPPPSPVESTCFRRTR